MRQLHMDNGSIRKLARLSQHLNLWLFCLLLLSMALFGVCYWALGRVLEEERDKIDIHFTRLMGDIREHEAFLLRIARKSDDATLKRDNEVVPLQRMQLWHEGGVEVYQGREYSFTMPFTLASRKHTMPVDGTPGPFALGVMLANFYASFWSRSSYPAPQALLFDLGGETSLAVPAMDSVPGRGGLARDTFLEVVGRVLGRVAERPPGQQEFQVHWARADNYYGDTRALLGYVGADLPDHHWWEGETQHRVVVASLLGLERINDYEKTLSRPLFGELTLFAPGGERLLGPQQSADLADGLSFSARGLLFKLRSQAQGGWVAVYSVGYPLFFRNMQWLLLVLPVLLLGCTAAGWLGLRWYARQVVGPAREAHRQVVESDVFSRTMIHTAPVAMCVLGRGGRQVVLHNQLAAQWLGDEKSILELLGPWQLFGDAVSQGEICVLVDQRYLQVAFAPTRYNGEEGLLCVFNDISAHREAQNALAVARHAADSANAAKTQFLASMSHEIRTPLYGLLGTLELLGRTRLDVQQRGYLQTIQGSSTTLLQLISDILDVTKIEAGQMVLALEDFAPLELAESVVEGFAASAVARKLQLYACIDPEVPARVRGDPARIRQVLNNLLSNALKFTDFGRVVLRLKVLGRAGGKVQLQWQVTDTGIGIPESAQSRLFEAFYQVDNDRHWVSGTGLGLSICWRLAQLMGGQLRVVSEPGLGSSFSLLLALPQVAEGIALEDVQLAPDPVYLRSPVRELAASLEAWVAHWGARLLSAEPLSEAQAGCVLLELLPDAEVADDWAGPRIRAFAGAASQSRCEQGIWQVSLFNLRGIGQALEHAQRGDWQVLQVSSELHPLSDALGLRVLVAEDNQVNQALLREQLEELGCQVRLGGDGTEALRLFEEDDFDVLLTDLNMPKMNGYQLATELRRRGADIPIIGVTANAMREEDERCRAVGMNAWLVKPLSLQVLHDALCGLMAMPAETVQHVVVTEVTERLVVPARMRELFLESMRGDLQQAERAIQAADCQALCRALHRMAGALSVVYGQVLAQGCRLLEEGLESGHVEVGDLRVQRLMRRIGAALQDV